MAGKKCYRLALPFAPNGQLEGESCLRFPCAYQRIRSSQWILLQHKAAVATSLAVIVVTSLVATSNNALKGGLIDWRIFAAASVGAAVAAWFGTDLMRSLSNPQLTRIFAITLIVFGVLMLVKKG